MMQRFPSTEGALIFLNIYTHIQEKSIDHSFSWNYKMCITDDCVFNICIFERKIRYDHQVRGLGDTWRFLNNWLWERSVGFEKTAIARGIHHLSGKGILFCKWVCVYRSCRDSHKFLSNIYTCNNVFVQMLPSFFPFIEKELTLSAIVFFLQPYAGNFFYHIKREIMVRWLESRLLDAFRFCGEINFGRD